MTGGGSGGHITPLLSLARELKRQSPDCQITYIGHKGDKFDTFAEKGRVFDFMAFIKAGKFRRYHDSRFAAGVFNPKTLVLNIRDFFRFPLSILEARRILKKIRPGVVFSKGGFVSVPVCAAAKLQGIPIVTHDSDTVSGLANRIVSRWAKVHATGMPAEYYDYPKNSLRYVGIPIEGRIKQVSPKIQVQAKAELGLPKDSSVLVVSGGGNGSRQLNNLVLSIAKELLENNLTLHIIHSTGQKHEADVKRGYDAVLPKGERSRVKAVGFSIDFYVPIAAADLIIARAGATTLAEMAASGKATIIIPSPFLAGGHQLKNAEALAKRDAAVVLAENVQPDELLAVVQELLADDRRRFELARNFYGTAKLDASTELAQIILGMTGQE